MNISNVPSSIIHKPIQQVTQQTQSQNTAANKIDADGDYDFDTGINDSDKGKFVDVKA